MDRPVRECVFTIAEAARIIRGPKPATIRRWIRDGKLPATPFQGRWYVSGEALEKLFNAQPMPRPPASKLKAIAAREWAESEAASAAARLRGRATKRRRGKAIPPSTW